MRRILLALVALSVILVGCQRDAQVASHNLSFEADNFRIDRRVIFLNGITDQYMLVIEGKCSILDQGNQLEVTCKVSEGDEPASFKKHFLGLSDNVTYFVEQLEGVGVSTYRYSVEFKPTVIVPDVEIDVGDQ